MELDRRDLALKHAAIADPWRLELPAALLDDPESAAMTLAAPLRGLASDVRPSVALRMQAAQLDLKALDVQTVLTVQERHDIQVAATRLSADEALRGVISEILMGCVEARIQVAAALKRIPQARRRELLDHFLPELLGGDLKVESLNSPQQAWWDKERSFIEEASSFDRGALLSAAARLMRTLEDALPVLLRQRGSFPAIKDVRWVETPWGKVIIAAAGATRHDKDALLIIDLGGDDVYDRPVDRSDNEVSVIIDLGGDDVYRDHAQGAGVFAVDILLDAAGDDSYQAGDIAQGAGVFGVGVLWDLEGSDSYQARIFAQGAGFMGAGLLVDSTGADSYILGSAGQGLGAPAGHGMLLDAAGNDTYTAGGRKFDPRGWSEDYGDYHQGDVSESMAQGVGLGWRERGAGGIGTLADLSGNDVYVADYFAQGSGYWLGAGTLFDAQGNDRYLARRYAQGAGVHYAAGALLDDAGNDVYSSWAVSQGSGHDNALGVLSDESGNDSYVMDQNGFLGQAASNACGVGLLLDAAGKDQYAGNFGAGMGFSGWDQIRQAQGVALLLDSGGVEDFVITTVDKKPWKRRDIGLGSGLWQAVFAEESPRAPVRQEPGYSLERRQQESGHLQARYQALQRYQGRTRLSEQLALSGLWGGGDEWCRRAKRDLWDAATVARTQEFMSLLEPHDVFAFLNMFEVFVKLGPASVPEALASLQGLTDKSRSRVLYFLAQRRDPGAAPAFVERLKDGSASVRLQAARGLARLGDKAYVKKLDALRAGLEPYAAAKVKAWFLDNDKSDMLEVLFAMGLEAGSWETYFSGLPTDAPDARQAQAAADHLASRQDSFKAWVAQRREGAEASRLMTSALADVMSDTDRDVRRWALAGLAWAGDPQACAIALQRLDDADFMVRETAVRVLRDLGVKSCKGLKNAADGDIRSARLAQKAVLGI